MPNQSLRADELPEDLDERPHPDAVREDYDATEKRIKQRVKKAGPSFADRFLDAFGAGKRWEKEVAKLEAEDWAQGELAKLQARKERDALFERLIEKGRKVNEGDRANLEFQALIDGVAERGGIRVDGERVAQAHAEAVAESDEALAEFSAAVARVQAARPAGIDVMQGFDATTARVLSEEYEDEPEDDGSETGGAPASGAVTAEAERPAPAPAPAPAAAERPTPVASEKALKLADENPRFDDILQETAVQWLRDRDISFDPRFFTGELTEDNFLIGLNGTSTGVRPTAMLGAAGLEQASERALQRFAEILEQERRESGAVEAPAIVEQEQGGDDEDAEDIEDEDIVASDEAAGRERAELHDPEDDWMFFDAAASLSEEEKEEFSNVTLPGIGEFDWSDFDMLNADEKYVFATVLLDEYVRLHDELVSTSGDSAAMPKTTDYASLVERAVNRFVAARTEYEKRKRIEPAKPDRVADAAVEGGEDEDEDDDDEGVGPGALSF